MLVSRVASAGSAGLASENVQLQAPPSQLQLPKATVSFAIAETVEAAEGSGAFIKVTVTTDKVAVAVALTSGASGYFMPVRCKLATTLRSKV